MKSSLFSLIDVNGFLPNLSLRVFGMQNLIMYLFFQLFQRIPFRVFTYNPSQFSSYHSLPAFR